jgi:phage terminase small subunit
MAGRPPKPTKLKLLEGTFRPDRARPDEPQPPAGEIVKPAFLKKRASDLWDEYAPLLEKMGTLTVVDPHVLAEWCQLTAKMERNRVSASERAQRRMIGAELGIGAAARAKAGVSPKPKQGDQDEDFLFRKTTGTGGTNG